MESEPPPTLSKRLSVQPLGREQVALCPQEYRFILSHTPSANSWDLSSFQPSSARQQPAPRPADRLKGKREGPRSVGEPGPRSPPVTAAREARRVGSSRVRAGEGRRRERRGRPVLAQPGPSLVPARPRALRSPSRLLCAGVRHSGPPSPRGGNSSRRSAAGVPSPSAKENTAAPAPEGPSPPSRRSERPDLRHRRLLLSSRSGPRSPETATAASRPAHARGRGVTWRLEGRRQKGRGGSPGPQTTPTAPHRTRPLLRPAPLAVAGRGHPRGRSPAQSAREDLIRLRASAAAVLSPSGTDCKLSDLRAYFVESKVKLSFGQRDR